MSFGDSRQIRPLDRSLVDKIAKGDVIESAVDVVKELVENSLDANSTKIEIRLSGSGLSMIQVNDNGAGIRPADLPFVCESFSTSKLHSCYDLDALSTLGFRGEALSAISHVSHLTILTKTCSEKCAFGVKYVNGRAVHEPRSCAGNVGTQVSVQKLFYNSSLRQSFKQNTQLHLDQIEHLIKCYAIHYCHVGFLLRLTDNDQAVLMTAPDSTPIDNIRVLYDNNVTRELIRIDEHDEEYNFRLTGLVTNASFSMKNCVFNLFVNNRFVESSCLKKIVVDIYEAYLSKNGKPFVYLSLAVNASDLDVNFHARKCEVFMLHENEICQKIGSLLKVKLLSQNQSRTFYMQSKKSAPDLLQPNRPADFADRPVRGTAAFTLPATGRQQPIPADPDEFRQPPPFKRVFLDEQQPKASPYVPSRRQKVPQPHIKESVTHLKSVGDLRSSIKQNSDPRISNVLSDSEFSGYIDFKDFLIKQDQKVFVCQTEHILIDYLYQKVLFKLPILNVLSFDEPVPILEIFDALPAANWSEISKTQAYEILMWFSSDLNQYFSIEIDQSLGLLKGLPELFERYKPALKHLPNFLFELARCCQNGAQQTTPVREIAIQVAVYYVQSFMSTCTEKPDEWEHFFETVIFRELKTQYRAASKVAEKMSIRQVADVHKLFSSFERC